MCLFAHLAFVLQGFFLVNTGLCHSNDVMLLFVDLVVVGEDAVDAEELTIEEAECFDWLAMFQADMLDALIGSGIHRVVGGLSYFGDLLCSGLKRWQLLVL